MKRVAVGALLAGVLLGGSATGSSAPPSPWDGVNPFSCELQHAGFGSKVPHPDADPLCVDFDKRHQSVADLGVVDFLSHEPARVALASDKCFYFQSDHWRGSVVQDNAATKTYEWDGHYFFDKATGNGGVWVTNFSLNGRTFDPSTIPGLPPQYAQHFGPGTGGFITHDEVPADPSCVAQAAKHSPYAPPPPAGQSPRCAAPTGGIGTRHLGPVTLGMPETKVWAVLGTPARVQRGFLHFCLTGGGKALVGIPGDRSGTSGGPSSRPAVVLLTTSTRLATAKGIAPGASVRALQRAYPRASPWFAGGGTQVTRLAPGLVAGVSGGRVRFLVAYAPDRVRSAAALRDWLRRSR
jgi:hypothetical protein